MTFDVIIPAYNPGSYIIEAIDSVLNQSYKKFNIIVVDDCSKEDLTYLNKKYPQIKLIRTEKNSGPAAARNLGIKNSNNELISFLDADDIMHKDKLLIAKQEFDKNSKIGLVCGNYQIILNRTRVLNPFYKKSIDINFETLMRQNFVASGSVSVRRNIIESVGGFDERFWIAEDYHCWLKISKVSEIKYVHKILYYYSIIKNNNSLTQRKDIQKKHLENLKIIKGEML